ncbi:MAG: hypothetical protein RLY30_539 [Pseudomonadota bacterium]|jgi:uncharacterized protein
MGTTLQPDLAPGLNRIAAYQPGAVLIGATRYDHSVLVLPQGAPQRWAVSSFESLSDDHLLALRALDPEVILLGTGDRMQLLPQPRLARLFPRTGVECMATDAACRTFNLLASEGRQVLAALILNPSNPSEPDTP